MKKTCFFVLFLALTMTLLVSYASDADFSKALRNCSHYSESGQVNTDGMSVHTIKHIDGWQGNKCTYTENMQYSGLNVNVVCKFTQPQLNELSSVMDAYSVVQNYSGEKVDLSNSSDVQNNPVVKVWNKYLQNSSVCKIDGLQ